MSWNESSANGNGDQLIIDMPIKTWSSSLSCNNTLLRNYYMKVYMYVSICWWFVRIDLNVFWWNNLKQKNCMKVICNIKI